MELRMTAEQILSLGPELADFLDEFYDCFARSEPRNHLANYIRGQLSDLPRKSVEPIADFTNTPRRTLQEFLSWSEWDHLALRDCVQQVVARDHVDAQAIGIIDDSGHPKSGTKTACVQVQWCGNTGQKDNCVVSVHLSYASYDTRFRAMLDSDLFLPKHGWDDPDRRAEAGIPDHLVYRPKYDIALAQLDRARVNGICFAWITVDEWYSGCPNFLGGLEARRQRYVAEIRRSFPAWSCDPRSKTQASYREVETLCRYSHFMMTQEWQKVYIKVTENGPMVWEFKCAPIWIHRHGQVLGPYWLIYTRNVLNSDEEKYFLSNATPGTPVEPILHVAFARWSMERTLEDEKSELGMSHFEVRKYDAIMRHLSVTQVSHLFLARQTKRLRGEKSGDHHLPSPRGRQCPDRRAPTQSFGSQSTSRQRFAEAHPKSTKEHPSTPIPHANTLGDPQGTRNQSRRTPLLHSEIDRK
jgi:SRSO17 transposase